MSEIETNLGKLRRKRGLSAIHLAAAVDYPRVGLPHLTRGHMRKGYRHLTYDKRCQIYTLLCGTRAGGSRTGERAPAPVTEPSDP